MSIIHVLSQQTIDKIAAGEVVERPSSVAKELAENAIDAGADRITIEIRDGGISMIRVTDNGKGIAAGDIPLAFRQHATSKIETVNDLDTLTSFGFRGEALSSIAAVSRVEMITKRPEDITATRYVIEGGRERTSEPVGAPDGTTIIVRDLFYNTPARAKFLKTAMTEGAHVGALVEQLILSNPGVAFRYIASGQTKLDSTGSGSLRDCIFHIYGKEVALNLAEVNGGGKGLKIHGYIGKPALTRGNRGYENYYINGRYVKSRIIDRAIEDGYRNKLMQHQYPFTCLFIDADGKSIDINVHPRKMEVRFSDEKGMYTAVCEAVKDALTDLEMIAASSLNPPETSGKKEREERAASLKAEGFETKAYAAENKALIREAREAEDAEPGWVRGAAVLRETGAAAGKTSGSHLRYGGRSARFPQENDGGDSASGTPGTGRARRPAALPSSGTEGSGNDIPDPRAARENLSEKNGGDIAEGRGNGDGAVPFALSAGENPHQAAEEKNTAAEDRSGAQDTGGKYVQQTFAPGFLSKEAKPLRRIVGQVFGTYWICEFEDKMYIFDQHAAHERVNFERFMRQYRDRKITSQLLSPPVIITADAGEQRLLTQYRDSFAKAGFEIEPFGGREFAVRSVPYTLGTIDSADLFKSFLDSMEISDDLADLDIFVHRVATEACKASVKGGDQLSFKEAETLLDEMMQCEDPYHCPHGRPTIISITEKDLEKKFKRIVS